ncbi:MAG: DUF2062 domain-containing protein [Victivallaceae bacterium]
MDTKNKNSFAAYKSLYCPDGQKNPVNYSRAIYYFLLGCGLRSIKFFYYKMLQNSSNPRYNALGVALGLFVGFFIPFGLQIAALIPLLYFIKASKSLAVAFTFVTNQLTILIIYPFQCLIGSYLIGRPLSWTQLCHDFTGVIEADGIRESFHRLFALGGEIGAGFFIGGFLLGVISAVPGYFITLRIIKRHRERKLAKRQLQHKERVI